MKPGERGTAACGEHCIFLLNFTVDPKLLLLKRIKKGKQSKSPSFWDTLWPTTIHPASLSSSLLFSKPRVSCGLGKAAAGGPRAWAPSKHTAHLNETPTSPPHTRLLQHLGRTSRVLSLIFKQTNKNLVSNASGQQAKTIKIRNNIKLSLAKYMMA